MSTEEKARYILQVNNIPRNSHRWADYEYGKALLANHGLFDYQAIKVLADWVGV